MSRPSDEAIAAAFWVQVSRQHEDDALIIWENGAQEVITLAAQFDADMHTIPEKVTTSPERVQIPAESTHVRCPRCPALMPVGLSCKGNPPDDPCPMRK
jgi:hypothetical protein